MIENILNVNLFFLRLFTLGNSRIILILFIHFRQKCNVALTLKFKVFDEWITGIVCKCEFKIRTLTYFWNWQYGNLKCTFHLWMEKIRFFKRSKHWKDARRNKFNSNVFTSFDSISYSNVGEIWRHFVEQ